MWTVLLVHVALAVAPTPLPDGTLGHAVAEASAIWAPYGVVVDMVDPSGTTAADAPWLTLAVVTGPSAVLGPRFHGPLGSIEFAPDGMPTSTITLYLANVLRFIRDARVLGIDESRWPPGLHDRIVGRVIGRVVAHEIGHFLLKRPGHATWGLMAAAHAPDAFAAPSRREFELTRAEVWRLAGGRKEKGPASAGPVHQTRAKR